MKIFYNFFMVCLINPIQITTVMQIATIHFSGTLVTVHSQGMEYGQICNRTINCFSRNITDPLECSSKDGSEGRCICPGDIFRNNELDRCVSPHNATCTLQSGDGLPIRTCTQFAQCWLIGEEGSSTNLDRVNGTCHCDADAKVEPLTSNCKLNYGSIRCKEETQCDVRSFVTCREGQCACQDKDDQVYSKSKQKCVVLAGGSCETVPLFLTPECAENMDCDETSKNCKCKDGFTQTPDSTCGKDYDQECTDESDCHPQFTCRSGEEDSHKKCICREGQEYHNGTSKCLILADKTCVTDELSGFECTFKASCDKERCVCETGYETSETLKCVALYGSECPNEQDIICKDADYLTSGENSTCICKDNYLGEDKDKKCRGLIGQNCRNNNNNEDCVANSICSTNGKCGCGEKQVESQDKNLCLAVLGGDCGMETLCSDAHFVSCTEGVCNCKDDNYQLPDQENLRCVAKADAPCGEGAAEGISCVANSTCLTEVLVCRCGDSLVNDGQGMCVPRQSDDSGSATVLKSGSLLIVVSLVMVMM